MNPFEYLMNIIMKQVTYDEAVDWLVNILTKSLPYIELGIKGVLLANLKATVDCNNDPRIPNWIRKNGNGTDEGLYFNLKGIDFRNIMSISPLSEGSYLYYFGTKTYYTIEGDAEESEKYVNKESAYSSASKQGISFTKIQKHTECDNVYQLARANDFNAFLWFVVHKGYFPIVEHITANPISAYSENYTIDGEVFTKTPFSSSDKVNNLGALDGEVKLTAAYRQPPFSPRKLFGARC